MTRVLGLLAGGAAALLAVAAVAAAGWWFFVREDDDLATDAPAIPQDLVSASATPGASTPGAGATGDGVTFTILSDRSEAAYFADEKLARLSLPSTAKGTTTIAGAFHLTADGSALDPAAPSTFTVDLTSLSSDEDRRDNRVQEALDTGRFPAATFTATSVAGITPPLVEGAEHEFQLTGILDLRGVQREVTWDVKARREGDVMTALATVNLRFEDFGIPIPNIAGFVSVEDDVTLQVQVVAQAS